MRLTRLTRPLACALLMMLVSHVQPSTLARQEATPATNDHFVERESVVATFGPFVDVPDRFISAANRPLLALLPGSEDAPDGFTLTNQSERTEEDVAAALSGMDEALWLLRAWGWNGNVFRDFELAEGEVPGPGGMTFLNISVHRFTDAEAATCALGYFSDHAATSIGVGEWEAPEFGETTRLLAGTPDGVSMAVLYVQRDQLLFRIGGSGADAATDPATDVVEAGRELMTLLDDATPSPAS